MTNMSMLVEKPCPTVAPVFYVSNIYGSPTGWNAALVGLLSSVLALIFLLVCLYYLGYRRRFSKEVNDAQLTPSPVPLVAKTVASTTIPVTTSSQTATTTFINEPGKDTKVNTFTEQGSGLLANNNVGGGDFAVNMPPLLGNGHTSASSNNGLLANGTMDPSELRLLQHEHH